MQFTVQKIKPRKPKNKYIQPPTVNVVLQQNGSFDEYNMKYKPIDTSIMNLTFENTEIQRAKIIDKLVVFAKQNINTPHFINLIHNHENVSEFREYLNNLVFESSIQQRSSWKINFEQIKNDIQNNENIYNFNQKMEKVHLFTEAYLYNIIEKELYDNTLYFLKKNVRYEWLESVSTNTKISNTHMEDIFDMSKLQTYYMQMLIWGYNQNSDKYPQNHLVTMIHNNLTKSIQHVVNDINHIIQDNKTNLYQFTQSLRTNKQMLFETNDRVYLHDDAFDLTDVFANNFDEYNMIMTKTNTTDYPSSKLYEDTIHKLIKTYKHNKQTNSTPPHKPLYVIITSICLYRSAIMLEQHMNSLHLETTIWTDIQPHLSHYFYIIINAKSTFIPTTDYIFWQIEQTDMKDKCTDKFSSNYMNQMNHAKLVWEISPDNIDFYKNKIEYKKVNHCFMPFYDTYNISLDNPRKYDLVFVGAMNTKRSKILDYVKNKMSSYKILIINNTFNDERDQLLKQSKYVFNVHYYDNAVLEIERFNHAIHCGCLILSENVKHDFHMKHYYDYFVRYFDTKNLDKMIQCLQYNLQDHVYRENVKYFHIEKEKLQSISKFYIHKNLLAADIHLSQFIHFEIQRDILLLTLVEDDERLQLFSKQSYLPDYQIFPAFKYKIGFTGCAMSYVTIAYNCLQQKKESIMIIEDDAVLCNDYQIRITIIHEFLTSILKGKWDVVNGYVCQIETSKDILGYYEYKGQIFLKLRKMVGTVCNLYNKRALERFVEFSLEIAKRNKSSDYHIDRFLNFDGIDIIVPYPFLADIQSVNSTIINTNDLVAYNWFKNEEKKTISHIEKFLKEHPPIENVYN